MSRLMPGRVRQEGIALYDSGQLQLEKKEQGLLFLTVGDQHFRYGLKDSDVQCSCSLFADKGYCHHLAATEYFIKNDPNGKKLLVDLEDEEIQTKEVTEQVYLGNLFLEGILSPLEDTGIRYSLSVEGSLLLYDQNIDWTLKISRLPDSRMYVIRDIGAFLRLVKQQKHYQIGKQYYEQIAYDYFDRPSQDLLDFLWDFVPEKPALDSDILVHLGRHFRLPQAYFEEGLDLLKDLNHFSFTYQQNTYSSVELSPFSARTQLFRFQVEVLPQMIELQVIERPFRSLFGGRFLLEGCHFYSIDRQQDLLIKAVMEAPVGGEEKKLIQIDPKDQHRLAMALLDLEKIGEVVAPKQFKIHNFTPQFTVNQVAGGYLELQLSLEFPDRLITDEAELEDLPFSYQTYHLEKIFQTLVELGFRGTFQSSHLPMSHEQLYYFLTRDVAILEQFGKVVISQELKELFVTSPPQISLINNGTLLDISFDFTGVTQEEVSVAVQALLEFNDFFVSQTGKIVVFDEETKQISQTLLDLRARFGSKGTLQLGKLSGYQLAERLSKKATVHFSEEFQEMVYDLAHPEEFSVAFPSLRATLRDYQQLGFKWLSMLDKYGFGGILADDMGLGKTLQVIAFLSSKINSSSRVLIVAPSSLIYNWQDEFKKFAPTLDVSVVYGSKEQREERIAQEHQILIASYSSFRQDSQSYQQHAFDYLILDEAQVMKNSQTKIARLLREFKVGNCFALSGTPIENHLTELWSLFQIVLPGLLPSKRAFGKLSTKEIARIIQPFILRRNKNDVLQELPDLIEINIINELTIPQKAVYLAQLKQMQQLVSNVTDTEISRRKIEILSGITRLRQICDTPSLFMEQYQESSGKLDSLVELLQQLKDAEHRVLIFSQFKGMLEKIAQIVAALGMTSYQLTGSTPAKERQEMTKAFNSGSRDVFLISLKAGGVGLNLTGADRVILVDLWWNPAVEAQAISRAHRMGQTEKVECYRLITRGTIEEKIQELQENKKQLVTTVLDGDEHRSSLTADDIRDILGLV